MIVVIAQPEEIRLVKELGFFNRPILVTGVGGVNVIKALKNIPKDEFIVNIGYCGSNTLPIGTKVYVKDVATLHEKALFTDLQNMRNTEIETHTCYTSTDFVTHTDIKEPCIFDMELAFIRAMFDNVYAIKVVSDNLNKKEYDDNLRGHQTKGNRTPK